MNGVYHSLSSCLDTGAGSEHSDRIGWALDGFPIYGPRGEGSEHMTNDELDACHGHTHEVEIDRETLESYHYHATMEYPYTIGCFRGTPVVGAPDGAAGGGAPGGDLPDGGPPGAGGGAPPLPLG